MKKSILITALFAIALNSIGQIKLPATKPAATKFGALAIDRNNGFFYGCAIDFDSQHAANEKALEECKKKGGNCSVVVSFSGNGCAAYCTVKSTEGTAYGWGVARTKTESDAIAVAECKKRSKGLPPSNQVWACNSTTSAPLREIYNAKDEIPAVIRNAGATDDNAENQDGYKDDGVGKGAATTGDNTKVTLKINNSVYSDWTAVKNPYSSMQVRYKLEKQDGDIGFYKTQLRINYDDESRCVDTRCLGYAVCFGYTPPDKMDFVFLHYKFYYPYKEIYTLPDLIPLKLLYPDGSKRLLKQDGGCYFVAKGNPRETYISCFNSSVDLILQGSPVKFNNFIESIAVVLK